MNRNASTMSMLYSLCNDTQSRSVVQLSLNGLYPYHYSGLSKSISALSFYKDKDTKEVASSTVEAEQVLQEKLYKEILNQHKDTPYWLLNTDVTPIYREHSACLLDRNFVKKNNVIKRKNGAVIGIGYEVSTVSLNLRRENGGMNWNPPLSMLRVDSSANSVRFGAQQVRGLLEKSKLFEDNDKLLVNALDSGYFSITYLSELSESVTDYDKEEVTNTDSDSSSNLSNLVSLIRVPSNRVVYQQIPYQADCNQVDGRSGAKLKYGEKMKLNDVTTHWEADTTKDFDWTSAKGTTYKVVTQCWEDMVIRGENERSTYDKPFRLVKIELVHPRTGEAIYKRPMWIAVFGKRRKELTLPQIFEGYKNRFDIEHFFSFGKKKLLLNNYLTSEVEHFDNWLLMVQLSYWMLYSARSLGKVQYHPWEKYNYSKTEQDNTKQDSTEQDSTEQTPTILSPIQTKRGFDRIISEFGMTPKTPKPRNNSSGRKKNDCPGKRPVHPVRKKAEYRAVKAANSS